MVESNHQSRQWDSTVFNDAEEVGKWSNQIESKQPFFSLLQCARAQLTLMAIHVRLTVKYSTNQLHAAYLWLVSSLPILKAIKVGRAWEWDCVLL